MEQHGTAGAQQSQVMIEFAVREAGPEAGRHGRQLYFRQPTACKRAIVGKMRRVTYTGSIFEEKPDGEFCWLFQKAIATQRRHPHERHQFLVNRLLDTRFRYRAPLGDNSRTLLLDLLEPVNGAVSSLLQHFQATRLPGARLDLKPSLYGLMLLHTFGQNFGDRLLRHGHGSQRRSGRLFAAALPGRPAPPPRRSILPAAAGRPEYL